MARSTPSQPKRHKNRKTKLQLVFDEEKRKEFLTGFHKRKLQRKKKAHDDLQEQLKSERKRLKQEARDSYKKLTVSHRPIPELEEFLEEKEYETEGVSVKVIELSATEIAKENNWIGPNQPRYESDAAEESESAEEANSDAEIEGMERQRKPAITKSTTETARPEFKTEKDLKKMLKKQATKNVQKSKAFQMKHKIERQKMKKKSFQQKKQRIKVHSKRGKRRGAGKFSVTD